MRKRVYLSLGSNMEDRAANLKSAIGQISQLGKIAAVSSLYETEPVEFTNQPWFLNCAVALDTDDNPDNLLNALLAIEQAMGRHRIQLKGPRKIDIDILLVDEICVNTATLTIPHPAMHERRFVLEPLAEIAPDARHPVLNMTVRELCDSLPAGQSVRRLPGSNRGYEG
jgi:2-amino-4-hydroxy-6-hydroxymethyldihydropteridine diphosphokinase